MEKVGHCHDRPLSGTSFAHVVFAKPVAAREWRIAELIDSAGSFAPGDGPIVASPSKSVYLDLKNCKGTIGYPTREVNCP